MKYNEMTPERAAKLKHYLHDRHKQSYVPKKDGTFKSLYRYINDGKGQGITAHKVIAETMLGRPLPKGGCLHHVNGNGLDNAHSNLVICPSSAYHMLLHKRQRALEECGNAGWLKCVLCGKYEDPALMYLNIPKDQTSPRGMHRKCNRDYKRRKYGKKGGVSD